jgi:hypothetical protein
MFKDPDRNRAERGIFTKDENWAKMWVKEGLHYVQSVRQKVSVVKCRSGRFRVRNAKRRA